MHKVDEIGIEDGFELRLVGVLKPPFFDCDIVVHFPADALPD